MGDDRGDDVIIGLDFDGVITEDPDSFLAIAALLQEAGHVVVCITSRGPLRRQEVIATVGDLMPMIFCGGRPKELKARQAGYEVDVWIDDNPSSITSEMVRRGYSRHR